MTIPEPLNTILLANTLIGLCVSTLLGFWFAAWLFEKLVDRMILWFKFYDILLKYAMYHREFKQWRKDKNGRS